VNRSPDQHWAQLDSLRCFAVLLVLMHHFAPEPDAALWELGHFAVRLFFVLSGFLITGILLRGRAAQEAEGAGGRGRLLARFYGRRFLRLAPPYYGVLALASLLAIEGVAETLPWHAAYASNFYFALAGTWEPWVANHFWSLAVEEQFYLVWPLVVLLAPRGWLLPIIVAAIAAGPVFRGAAILLEWNDMTALTLPFASLDALALGALLAVVGKGETAGRRRLGRLALAGAPLILLLAPLFGDEAGVLDAMAFDFATALAALWLVGAATQGIGRFVGRVLSHAVPVYLGRISYGIYLYHPLVKWAVFETVPEDAAWLDEPVLAFLVLVPLTLAAAALSWHCLEAPLVRLKSRLPYVGVRRRPDPARAAPDLPLPLGPARRAA
jgi:peptidoglycan/LPS O-acetylase OafA/YrhL